MYCKFCNLGKLLASLLCINSSKVYCKFISHTSSTDVSIVLIVAKCIVNYFKGFLGLRKNFVLIVAKCIVNFSFIISSLPNMSY